MIRMARVATAALLLGGLVLLVAACGQQGGGDATPKGKAQTTCPIMGRAIDKKVFADYQGKRIYFCCEGCPDTFQKDPAKYVKKLEDEGVVLEKAPTKGG